MASRPGDWNCPGCGELCFAWRDTCRSCNTSRPNGGSFNVNDLGGGMLNPEKQMASNAFPSKQGDWNCPSCGQLVFAWRDSCRSCNTPKPGGGGGGGGGGGKGERPGDWNCPNCGELCFKWRDSCRSCGTAKSAAGGGGGGGGGGGAAAGLGALSAALGGVDAGVLQTLLAAVGGGGGGGGGGAGAGAGKGGGSGFGKGGGAPGGLSKPGDWNCPNCGELCFSYRDSCRQCNTPRGSAGGGARVSPYGGGGGKGGGKKGDKQQFDKSKTVWIGSLPDGATNEHLMELGKTAGNCIQALVVKKGTGLIEYGSPEEVMMAIPVLSGAMLGDSMIQADFWQK